MDCNDIKELLSSYVDDELDDEQKKLIEDHIKNCENCRNELEEYRMMLQKVNEIPQEEPPKGYCSRLHDKLLKAKTIRGASQKFRWAKYVSVAAALVIVVGIYAVSNLGFRAGSSKSKAENSTAYDYATTETKQAPMVNDGYGAAVAPSEKPKTADSNRGIAVQSMDINTGAQIQDKVAKIIKSGSISSKTENFDKFIGELSGQVNFLGGFIEQNNTNIYRVYKEKELKNGYLKIRVPDEKFYEFVEYLEKACDVTQKNITEADVTKDYYEKDNRVKNLEVQEEHLRELFSKASTVEEMLKIESELNRVRTEIDALKISLSDIDDRASMSTVDLQIEEVLPPDFDVTDKATLWDRAKEGFINTVNSIVDLGENLIIALISISPVLVFIAAAAVIAVAVYRKHRKKIK